MEAEGRVPSDVPKDVEAQRAYWWRRCQRWVHWDMLGTGIQEGTDHLLLLLGVCCHGTVLPTSLAAAACNSQYCVKCAFGRMHTVTYDECVCVIWWKQRCVCLLTWRHEELNQVNGYHCGCDTKSGTAVTAAGEVLEVHVVSQL
jgi:hypothetical protein